MGSNETPTNIELQDDVTAALQDANTVDSTLGAHRTFEVPLLTSPCCLGR